MTVATLLHPPFWFYDKVQASRRKNIRIREKIVYTIKLSGFKSVRFQRFHFKFRIQNLRRHVQAGGFLFRIRPLV